MKKTAVMLAAMATIVATPGAWAQRDARHFEKGVVTVINTDTAKVSLVEKHLKENAPAAPNDNGLPRFAIVGKDHQYYLGIGAQFLGEAAFDFGDNISSPVLFTPSAITPSTPGNGSSLGFGWQTSSIYFNAVAMPGTDNQVGLFFKGNFMGNGDSFNVQHFYAKYRGLKAGYTTSLFTDAAAEPMTIDFEGPNGYPFITLFTASWTQKFNDHVSAAVGIEAPTTAMTVNSSTEQVNQRIPTVPVYLQYGWNEGNSHVRLSGIVRPMQYRDMTKGENKTLTGLGVQLSGMTPVVGPLSFNYNVTYGRGIATYLQDDNGLNIDAVPMTEQGEMGMVNSLGVTGSLNYAFNSKVSTNLVYSHLTNWLPSDAASQSEQYRYGDYVAANVIYNVNKFFAAGIEYDYGHRKSFDGQSLHTNRIQVQMSVTF